MDEVAAPDARLEVEMRERALLLSRLESMLTVIGEVYDFANQGKAWDPHDEGVGRDIAIVVRARDALRSDGPWALEAPSRDLEVILTQVRTSAAIGLEVGARPLSDGSSLNESDPATTDEQLDVIALCDRLLEQLRAGGSAPGR